MLVKNAEKHDKCHEKIKNFYEISSFLWASNRSKGRLLNTQERTEPIDNITNIMY